MTARSPRRCSAELVEGTYWVLDGAGTPIRPVEITGGELATIDLREFRF